ncbi:hypothetical protein ACFX11_014975 [Malus domestica]
MRTMSKLDLGISPPISSSHKAKEEWYLFLIGTPTVEDIYAHFAYAQSAIRWMVNSPCVQHITHSISTPRWRFVKLTRVGTNSFANFHTQTLTFGRTFAFHTFSHRECELELDADAPPCEGYSHTRAV